MAPVSDPGTSPSPLDTLAVSGGYPSARSTGKVTSVPEPTIALIIPAHTPATTMMRPCATLTSSAGMAPGSAGGLVRLDDRLRDAAAVAHLVTVLARPPADRGRFLTARARGLVRHCGLPRSASASTATGLAGNTDVGRERVTEPGRVLIRQVDLVSPAFEGEVEGARCVRPVQVVDEPDGRLLCHCALPSLFTGCG